MRLRHSFLASLVIALAMLVTTPRASGELIYYESFSEDSLPTDYLGTTPDIGGVWTAYAGTSNEPDDQIVSGSMDTMGTLALPAIGGKLHVDGYDIARGLSMMAPDVGADGTTVWASFLMDIPGPGETAFSGIEMWDGSPTYGDGNRSIRAGWTGDRYAVETNRGTGSVALNASTTNFVVLQFNYVTGNDTVAVFVNPTLNELLTGDYDGTLTGGDFSFYQIGLGHNNQPGVEGYVDEIRVGTRLVDVAVPEPSSFALLGLGILVLATNRIRTSRNGVRRTR